MKRLIGIIAVAFVILGVLPYPLHATTGPIFWVQANQGYSGSTLNDLSGFGRHIQLNGSWYQDNYDYLGGSYGEVYFDSGAYGESPLVTFANHTVSMEVIFYTLDPTIGTQMVFYNGSESAGNGYGVALVSNGYQSELQVRYGGIGWISTGFIVNSESWYHTVVTIGSNGDIRVYVSGTLRHTRNYTLPNMPLSHTRIGNTDVASSRGLYGGVSVARMYDRELTSSEVLRLSIGNLATSTPTATATFTPSNTPTRTFTNTPTATVTASNTPTATVTASNTPTATMTASNTPTATMTASNTSTATASPTPTHTPSNTPTTTDTPGMTATSTATSSPTLSSGQKTATGVAAKTVTAVMGQTQTVIVARTQTAVVRTRTAVVASTQTAVVRTRTANARLTQTAVMAKTRTAVMAKTNTVIAKTRTSTRTRTATRRSAIMAPVTPTATPTVAVTR